MARLPRMRLRVSEILDERGMTAYGLAKASHGALSLSQAYRLAADEWDQLPRETLTALCDALAVEPGDLFAYRPGK
jgi:DNA-binding Xre family transcriptional regulator